MYNKKQKPETFQQYFIGITANRGKHQKKVEQQSEINTRKRKRGFILEKLSLNL